MGDFLTYFPWTITINLMVSCCWPYWSSRSSKSSSSPPYSRKKRGQVGHRPRTRPLPPRTGVDVPPRLADDLDGHRHGHRIAADRHAAQAAHGALSPTATSSPWRSTCAPTCRWSAPPAAVGEADSVYRVLHDDARVKSVTSFVGCSSPRFQMSYAPADGRQELAHSSSSTPPRSTTPKISSTNMPTHGPTVSRGLCQIQAARLPERPLAGVPVLRQRHRLAARRGRRPDGPMRGCPSAMGTPDYEDPRSVIDAAGSVTAPQLGVTRTLAAVNLALASGDVPVGSVWEGDYRLPIVLKNDTRQGRTLALRHRGHLAHLVAGAFGQRAPAPDRRRGAVWSQSK